MSTTSTPKSVYLGVVCIAVLLLIPYLKPNTSHLFDRTIPTETEGDRESETVIASDLSSYIPPLNPDYNQDFADLDEADSAALQRTRRILTRIRENCKARNLATDWSYDSFDKPRLLIAKREYNILYGSNPKTGSTSFKKFTFLLDGVEGGHNFHGNPDGHYKRVSKGFFSDSEDFKNFIKIAGIRNPLVRLISAFRNKQLREHQYIHGVKNVTDDEQFLRFIEKLPGMAGHDVHLKPQSKQMEFCRFPYDILIEVENSSGAIKLMQKLTRTTETPFPGDRVAVGKDTNSSMDCVYHFYSLLNKTQMDSVYELYKVDFDILPYTRLDEPGFPDIKL